MAEDHPDPQLDHVLRLDDLRHRLGNREPSCRSPHDRRVARGVGRRDQQQATGITGQPGQASREALLDARGQRHRGGQPEPARELDGRQPAGQLQQGERVAVRLQNDPIQHVLIQASGQNGLEQCSRVTMPQRLNTQIRQPRERVSHLTGREHERDVLGKQAAGDECERARRRAIEPLRVIDDTQQGSLLRGLREQAEDGQPDQERIRRRSGTQPEGYAERIALGIR